jgi:hypothetical protein
MGGPMSFNSTEFNLFVAFLGCFPSIPSGIILSKKH